MLNGNTLLVGDYDLCQQMKDSSKGYYLPCLSNAQLNYTVSQNKFTVEHCQTSVQHFVWFESVYSRPLEHCPGYWHFRTRREQLYRRLRL